MRTTLLFAGISLILLSSCTSETSTTAAAEVGGTKSQTAGGATAQGGSGSTSDSSAVKGGSGSTPDNGGSVASPVGGAQPASGGSATTSGGKPTNGGSSAATNKPANGGAVSGGGRAGVGGSAKGGSTNGGTEASSGRSGTAGGINATITGAGRPSGVAGRANSGGRANAGGRASAGGNAAGGSSSTPPSSAGTSGGGELSCTREGLQAAVDAYLAAQAAGDPTKMPLAASPKYTENFKSTTAGIWKTPLTVAFTRSLLDVTACQTFSEVFVTEGTTNYVIGMRLAVKDGKISELESVVTQGTISGSTITSKDWNFDAKAYLECDKSEDWSVVPAAEQSTREELIAAGEAYFAIFSDENAQVPWGEPCYRLEGGKGCTPAMDKASKSCNVGIPSGITFKNTHWVVDVELNAAVGFTQFGGASPDTHLFRLVDGKIRYVHTLTQGTG